MAAGAILSGMSRQVGNEIDEFLTGALRNNLVGLPLDLGAVNIARARQREGDIDSLALLDAERTFADAEAALATADAQIADTQVDLFKALGGGWQTPQA